MQAHRDQESKRSYNQYCAVARGLDAVGERWTLLIVRDLLTGPKRYKDLLLGLPGIGTNLLAARLRQLEEQGIVERRLLPPPAGSAVYALTATGEALEPAIMALGRWGARLLGTARDTDFVSATAYIVAMRAAFVPAAAVGVSVTYELRVGNQVFAVSVRDGRCTTAEGHPNAPDAVITLDVRTLGALLHHEISPEDALAEGRVTVDGALDALQRLASLFVLRFGDVASAEPTSTPLARDV